MYLVIFQILNINSVFLLIIIHAVLVITESMIQPNFSLSEPLEIPVLLREYMVFMERIWASDCSFIIFQFCELGQVI